MNFQNIGIKRIAIKMGKIALGLIKWVLIVIFSFSLIWDFYHFFYMHPSADFFDLHSSFFCELGDYLELEPKGKYKDFSRYKRSTQHGLRHCIADYIYTSGPIQRQPSCAPYVEFPLEIKHCRSQHYMMFKRSCYMPMFLNEFFEKKFSEKRGEKFYPYDQPCIDPPSEPWKKRYRTCRDLPPKRWIDWAELYKTGRGAWED